MGFFQESKLDLRSADRSEGGLYFQPGNYKVEVNRVKMVKSATTGRDFFTVETTVLESDNDDLRPGMSPSWMVELPGKYPDTALGNVKDFLLAGYGYFAKRTGDPEPDKSAIGDEEADAAISEENVLSGAVLKVSAFNKLTKQNKDFTRVKWGIPEVPF